MKFGKLDLDPAVNPGVLDTETWSTESAWSRLSLADFDWAAFRRGTNVDAKESSRRLQVWRGSEAHSNDGAWCLASLPDGQSVFCHVGQRNIARLVESPIGSRPIDEESTLTAFSTSAANVDHYTREIKPDKGSRALGATPRLGIGSRMTTQVWPGMFDAMSSRGMAANSIQNSIRELSLLDDLLDARPPESNYSTGVGQIVTGWTGSTYEGLWLSGVLAALKSDHSLDYGADADHVQVKRGAAGLERAKRVIRAARYYSFYTLDMADVLKYSALDAPTPAAAEDLLVANIPDAAERKRILAYHSEPFVVGNRAYQLTKLDIGRLVGKHWESLAAVGELVQFISDLKGGVPFDLELTIDEHPPEISAFDCLTSDEEVLFLARECRRRNLPITHLAPNFGQEKGRDYRAPDGLDGLERRVRSQFAIASEFGLMLDVHSGDDLGPAARQVFGRSTDGQLHFKVSPMLQQIYAQLLREFHPDLFQRWWDDALSYARREATGGSPVARRCLDSLANSNASEPSAEQDVFHYYSFPYVGRRDADGQFLHRHEFYQLSPKFCDAYQQVTQDWLCQLADDISLT